MVYLMEHSIEIKFDTGYKFNFIIYDSIILIYIYRLDKNNNYISSSKGIFRREIIPPKYNPNWIKLFNKEFLKTSLEHDIITIENDIIQLTNFTKLKLLGQLS